MVRPPLFFAKIRTEVFVSDGFVGVVNLTVGPVLPLFLAKIRTEILFRTDFVRFAPHSLMINDYPETLFTFSKIYLTITHFISCLSKIINDY